MIWYLFGGLSERDFATILPNIHESSDFVSSISCETDPINEFRSIALKHNLTHLAINDILKWIQCYYSRFPSPLQSWCQNCENIRE